MTGVPYGKLLRATAQRMGWDPSRLQHNQANALATYLNTAVNTVWQFHNWPEFTQLAEFPPETAFPHNNGSEYRIRLEALYGIWSANPDEDANAVPLPCRITEFGVLVADDPVTSVWIKWKPSAPQFSSEVYDPATTYSAYGMDSEMYLPEDGHCYRCISATPITGIPLVVSPLADPGTLSGSMGIILMSPAADLVWQKQLMPWRFVDAIVNLAFAEALEEEDQVDKAARIRDKAMDFLENAFLVHRGDTRDYRNYRTRAVTRTLPVSAEVVRSGVLMSIYLTDENGNLIRDDNGNPITTSNI